MILQRGTKSPQESGTKRYPQFLLREKSPMRGVIKTAHIVPIERKSILHKREKCTTKILHHFGGEDKHSKRNRDFKTVINPDEEQ